MLTTSLATPVFSVLLTDVASVSDSMISASLVLGYPSTALPSNSKLRHYFYYFYVNLLNYSTSNPYHGFDSPPFQLSVESYSAAQSITLLPSQRMYIQAPSSSQSRSLSPTSTSILSSSVGVQSSHKNNVLWLMIIVVIPLSLMYCYCARRLRSQSKLNYLEIKMTEEAPFLNNPTQNENQNEFEINL